MVERGDGGIDDFAGVAGGHPFFYFWMGVCVPFRVI